jgi:tetrahydromethanopterin S-methyltransferase subunit F
MDKEPHLFGRDRRLKSGLCSWCKVCVAATKVAEYKNNPEKFRNRKKEEYQKNKENILARVKSTQDFANQRRRNRYALDPTYRQKLLARNKTEAHRERMKKWREANSSVTAFYNSNRRSLKANATPTWLTAIQKAQIQEIYDIAKAITVQTGIPHEVDHIHPLCGKNFNGIHVPWNLRVIPASENRRKSNNLPAEDQSMNWGV